MIYVDVVKESNFPVPAGKIKEAVKKTLTANGIVSDSQVAVALVHRKKMAEYAAKYYHSDDTEYDDGADHPVLSFPESETEGRFVFPDDGKLYLGEIIVSYDWCVAEAGKTGKLVEAIVVEMVEHGVLHLIGIHHD